jgi:murein DD-endopeptidase MepM/ murein hydrolase activator NlpD
MILLKNLLNEIDFFQNLTQQFDTSVANSSKLNILAIGDNEVLVNYSFANQLKRHLDVNITTAGYRNVNANAVLKILNRRLDSKFQIVIIMVSGNNDSDRSPNNAIQQLAASFTLAKKYGARVIAITNPTKEYLTPKNKLYRSDMYPTGKQIATWVNSQNITDETIDTYNLSKSSFNRDNLTLTAREHKNIMGQVKTIINMFNFKPKEIAPIEDKETDTDTLPDTSTELGLTTIDPQVTISGNFSGDLLGQATELLKKFEGLRLEPYWDTNNWRIGYGSSTITKADGTILKLSNNRASKPNITITDEDAARDLKRRLSDEFIPKVLKQLGASTDYWTDGTKAALTSICYNYGSLPQVIVNAAQSKDINNLSAAINTLSSNKKRRLKELSYILQAENLKLNKDNILPNIDNNTKIGGETKGNQYFPTASRRGFGMQTLQGVTRMHYGQDYPAPAGLKVLVLKPGKCIKSTFESGAGNIVKIKHDDGTVTTYMHFSELLVNKGDRIESGTVIGLIGSTGHSTGPHLHFEYRATEDSDRENPKAFGPEYFILQRT